ncbi:MAG: hypothetical protein ACPGWR_26550, partial [Ardenticatenaceae bacterium]
MAILWRTFRHKGGGEPVVTHLIARFQLFRIESAAQKRATASDCPYNPKSAKALVHDGRNNPPVSDFAGQLCHSERSEESL